ncbi:MAG: DUF6484 domain-containing protein [Pseudomonadota bacterium]
MSEIKAPSETQSAGDVSAAETPPPDAPARIDGLMTARLDRLGDGVAGVSAPGLPVGAASARIACALAPGDVGGEVVLAFENADPMRPLIIGRLVERPAAPEQNERETIEAEEELTLRCGRASLTLTRAGKVLIRGAYVSSRSTGVHRIKGGSVEIN